MTRIRQGAKRGMHVWLGFHVACHGGMMTCCRGRVCLGVVATQGRAGVLLPEAEALRVVQGAVAVHKGGLVQVGRVEGAVHAVHQLVEAAAQAVARVVQLRQGLRSSSMGTVSSPQGERLAGTGEVILW